ncbi:hypothetical protein B0H17DRAFT_1286025 [Mycena rosella]|uniref:Uncharacterized protein n=1 Tax=Mycena rosella TaxID=1033263 RepID=A0AAD7DHP0_MYCRO|nr:hypothetical protein B0H17DRAFT_1286025 [Mycena rosella]
MSHSELDPFFQFRNVLWRNQALAGELSDSCLPPIDPHGGDPKRMFPGHPPHESLFSCRAPSSPHPWSYSSPKADPIQQGDNFPQLTTETPLLPQTNSGTQQQNTGSSWLVRFPLIFLMVITVTAQLTECPTKGALDPAVRNEMRHEWAREIRAHEIRRVWSAEVAEHEKMWEHERQQIISMREQLAKDREEKSEEGGGRGTQTRGARSCGVRLGRPQSSTLPATRRAAVYDVPREYDSIKACMETAVEIHGLKIPRPDQGEDMTHILFKTYNVGMYLSGIWSQKNLQPADDWREMCSTMPADFRHLHLDSPTVCENWGVHGVWGIWGIEDHEC